METETLEPEPFEPADGKQLLGDSNPSTNGIGKFEWIGVAIVTVVAVLPDLFTAITTLVWMMWGTQFPEFKFSDTLYGLLWRSFYTCATTIAVITFIGRRWAETGFRWLRLQDFAWALGIYLAGYIAYLVVFLVIPDHWFYRPDFANLFPPAGENEEQNIHLLIIAVSLANGMAEELVIRAYLFSRLEVLLKSTWAAVLITTAMFASYHIYQGAESMLGIFGLGLVFAFAFVKLRSIWPLFLAHAFADYVGLIAMI